MATLFPQGYLDDLDRPDLDLDGLWAYLRDGEGIPVTRNQVRNAVLRREISPTRIGRKNYFCKRDALEWLESRKQQGKYRAVPNRAPQEI